MLDDRSEILKHVIVTAWEDRKRERDYIEAKTAYYKSQTRTIPTPLREAPSYGITVYTVSPFGAGDFTWSNTREDRTALTNGAVHATLEAAQQHYEALFAPTRIGA